MSRKYSQFLTILLVLIIIAIVGIIAFLGYKYYETYVIKNTSEDFVESFVGDSKNDPKPSGKDNNKDKDNDKDKDKDEDKDDDDIKFDGVEDGDKIDGTSGSTEKKFNGFIISGTIEIPATKLKCPVLAQSEYSTKALDTSVVELYGPGLNKVGVTTIVGHNYRNGTFFSNNKKLQVGDKIFITDLNGKRLSYTIYDKFDAAQNDTNFMVKDTQGGIEIVLQTCTDDSKERIIILAKADV